MTKEQKAEQENHDKHVLFARVCDMKDWKKPIDSICSSDEIKQLAEVIQHFTATNATFDYLGPCKEAFERFNVGDLLFKVRADGYRKGPAGDH